MNITRLCVALGLIMGAVVSLGQALKIDNEPYTGAVGAALEVRNGRKMMLLKGVPEGDRSLGAVAWSFPASVMVGEAEYHVSQTSAFGDYDVIDNSQSNNVRIASGAVTRMQNSELSRVCGFGRMATSNLGVHSMALQTQVRVLDDSTNTLYIASVHRHPEVEEVLVYKNIYLRISGTTNKFVIATSLLRAGLPERERTNFPGVQQ